MYVRTVIIAVAAIVGSAGSATAQNADAIAVAEQLFDQGRDLMKKGDLEAACRKFAASFEIDEALGTLLNLARCYEEQGKLASAWKHYKQAAEMAVESGQAKREAFAREQARECEQRMPRLVIRVPAESPGMTIARDGMSVDRALWGTAVYVDPGEHQITATAPGYRTLTTTVTAVEAEEVVFEVPALERSRTAGRSQPGEPHLELAPPPQGRGAISRRTLGMATGGAGLVALAAGFGAGLSARSAWNEAFTSDACNRDTLVCTPEGQERTDSARTRATASTVLVGTGVALVATGIVLYVTAPDGKGSKRPRVAPLAGPNELGIALISGF